MAPQEILDQTIVGRHLGDETLDERIEAARLLYERAVFGGDTSTLLTADAELDAVEADLVLARGRIVHARLLARAGGTDANSEEAARELEMFERAAELYRGVGDVRGEGEALLWVGIFHQVVRHDDHTAVPLLTQAYALAAQGQDRLTMSYALRHLGIADHGAGRLAEARSQLEQSTALRREVGFSAGVAANLVGLAYIASAQGRRGDALALIDEAHVLAQAGDAHGILAQVQEARGHLAPEDPSV